MKPDIKLERRYSEILKNFGFPGSVAETLALFLVENENNFSEVLSVNEGEHVFSYNDIYVVKHKNYYGFGDVVEIANPYSLNEFSIVGFNDFMCLCKNLIEGKIIGGFRFVTNNPRYRSDGCADC